MLRISTLVLLVLSLTLGVAASPAAMAPPESQIESLDDALLESMKAGPAATAASRYRNLAPVVEKVFDLRAMTGFAVGPTWGSFSPDDQQAAIAAFTRLTIASYAHNFHEYGGEKFVIDPNVVTRGVDKIVQTKLLSPAKEPTSLNYRMRSATGAWRIIDVYYGSISQLTIRRSDFAAPLAAGGAKGLIAHLNSLSDDLIK